MANKIFAQGTHIYYEDPNNAGTWIKIAQVQGDVELPQVKRDVIETTDHDSPGGFKEKMGTLIDPGTAKGTVNYDPAEPTHAAMFGFAQNNTLLNWKAILVDIAASVFTWSGYVTTMGPVKAPVNNIYTCPFEITITGAITHP